MNFLKKLFFWNYARNTWQWDVLCVVILIFIFLTPNRWFAHQSPAVTTVLVSPELIDNTQDKGRVEQVVRTLTGRQDVQVISIRPVFGKDGKTRGYEVDIR